MNDNLNVTGRLHCILRDEHGNIKQEWEQPNLVTTAGKQWIAARCQGTSTPAAVSYMAIGTGATAPAVGDTALVTESIRKAASTTHSAPSNTITYSATFAAGEGTGTLLEAGLFNAASAGTMPARTAINVVKAAGDSLTINWTLTVG